MVFGFEMGLSLWVWLCLVIYFFVSFVIVRELGFRLDSVGYFFVGIWSFLFGGEV